MIIALDYDGTYTADKGLWRSFILNAQFRGHTVYMVTLRDERLDYEEEFKYIKDTYQVDTIFCSGHSKRQVTQDHGIFVDIFIDDQPEFIPKGVDRLDMTLWRKEKPEKKRFVGKAEKAVEFIQDWFSKSNDKLPVSIIRNALGVTDHRNFNKDILNHSKFKVAIKEKFKVVRNKGRLGSYIDKII